MAASPQATVNLREVTEGSALSLPPACVLADKEVLCLLCGRRTGLKAGGVAGNWVGTARGGGVDQWPPSGLRGWRLLLPQPGEPGRELRGRERLGLLQAAGHNQGPRQPAGGRSARPPVSLAAVEPVNYSRGLSSPCGGGRAGSQPSRRETRSHPGSCVPGAMAVPSSEEQEGWRGPGRAQPVPGRIRGHQKGLETPGTPCTPTPTPPPVYPSPLVKFSQRPRNGPRDLGVCCPGDPPSEPSAERGSPRWRHRG